jgi:phosphoribosylformylglycinamidine cyclo-ligase
MSPKWRKTVDLSPPPDTIPIMTEGPKTPITYKDSGVDIVAGDRMVDLIQTLVKRTHNPRVVGGLGGFAGLFRLDYDEKLFKRNYKEPVLAACTDGVGSKLKIAFEMNKVDTVGIDLVAMNVNDLICCGADPLFFLDYLGVGKLDPQRMAQIIKGITDGCMESDCCPLLGGETAEMPDFYAPNEFDMAGFAVGVVERRKIVDGSDVEAGDVAIALASSGLHSNGYSLARKVLLDRAGFSLDDRPAELEGVSVGEAMLCPTRIYVKCVLDILGRYKVKKVVKALAHITGSGLPGNLPRVLPEGLTVRMKRDSWTPPAIFKLIAAKGPVDAIEMMNVFNMGVGFVMVVAPTFATAIMKRLRELGERCWILGKVRKGGPDLMWT